ncbi:unnamed protein product, partial [Ixodes pacificus]
LLNRVASLPRAPTPLTLSPRIRRASQSEPRDGRGPQRCFELIIKLPGRHHAPRVCTPPQPPHASPYKNKIRPKKTGESGGVVVVNSTPISFITAFELLARLFLV